MKYTTFAGEKTAKQSPFSPITNIAYLEEIQNTNMSVSTPRLPIYKICISANLRFLLDIVFIMAPMRGGRVCLFKSGCGHATAGSWFYEQEIGMTPTIIYQNKTQQRKKTNKNQTSITYTEHTIYNHSLLWKHKYNLNSFIRTCKCLLIIKMSQPVRAHLHPILVNYMKNVYHINIF